jgi:thiol:disulfide interchange protein
MFYVYLIFGFVLFGAGLFLIPGYWKLAWVAACFALVMFLPVMLAALLDPINTRRIRSFCASVGASDVKVEPFPNHYGVHFRKNDQKHYAKCTVTRGKIKWKGLSPAEIS